MGKIQSFKQEFSFDERLEESKSIIAKYPDRVPVIIERYSRTDLPEMEKKKFLVPRDMSVGQFIHILSSRLHLTPGKALFVFVKNTLPQTASRLDSIYETYKEDDSFLDVLQQRENLWLILPSPPLII
ncbi:autophagy-related protein 8i-like isoform X1 [Malus sylvestris]|uniref:autophagy-related protein 8i-like isoform X1 n=1 Tax=Malus sylvestris TaxID=3752 RepID=UPI0021AC4975|nr:autophagy-related protein 8i-like isoform X1 [Malus sylvestris]